MSIGFDIYLKDQGRNESYISFKTVSLFCRGKTRELCLAKKYKPQIYFSCRSESRLQLMIEC